MCKRFNKQQYILSWTDFNTQICDDETVLGSSVPCMQHLEATPDEYGKIYEIML